MAKLDYNDIGYTLLLIFVLGFVLVLLQKPLSEGFESQAQRCGVDLPCGGFLKCINGFCAKTETVPLHEKNPVELLDTGDQFPYVA
jgi:hypothetical protein